MLIKEYRIALPLTTAEYRIAQLYMIQKKSREESHGRGSGVEILVNEPYTEGPGGAGQYTHKIFHIGSHLPGWFRAILPKSALQVSEEAWNAYPYTKTIYRCPFIDKFMLEIETRYLDDGGETENIFNLSASELKNRIVDYLDIVADPISSGDYLAEEDPTLFQSKKTGRGPLTENWWEEHTEAMRNKGAGTSQSDKVIMCAYKLCRVEFRYWGMQSKIESFIHDVALRRTMLRAHRQAWSWQDEYQGLTLDDIRRLEQETQEALRQKMAQASAEGQGSEMASIDSKPLPPAAMRSENLSNNASTSAVVAAGNNDRLTSSSKDASNRRKSDVKGSPMPKDVSLGSFVSAAASRRLSWETTRSELSTPTSPEFRAQSPLEHLQAPSSSDEEFYDAEDGPEKRSIARASSMDLLTLDDDEDVTSYDSMATAAEGLTTSLDRRKEQYRNMQQVPIYLPQISGDVVVTSPVLFLVIHGGSIFDIGQEQQLPKQADVDTLHSTFDLILRTHYPAMRNAVTVKLVPCPSVCTAALNQMVSLSPTASASYLEPPPNHNLLLGALPLIGTETASYGDAVSQLTSAINHTYHDFLRTEQGQLFTGHVNFICDSVGALLFYDVLSPRVNGSGAASRSDDGSREQSVEPPSPKVTNLGHADLIVTLSNCDGRPTQGARLDCDVGDVFLLGSPLGLVMAYRQMTKRPRSIVDKHIATEEAQRPQPACHQIYNLFYQSDPSAVRLEPLVIQPFQHIAPIHIPRYSLYPLGDGLPIHIVDTVQAKHEILTQAVDQLPSPLRRNCSVKSTTSTSSDVNADVIKITQLCRQWWGTKRLDYCLFAPPGLQSFPANTLPFLLHASFWESTDAVAFILRQVIKQDIFIPSLMASTESDSFSMVTSFVPLEPREKWLRRRTTLKVKSVPNHRANDVVVLEGSEQVLTAKFMYGALDMSALSKEKVDIYVMTTPPNGEWVLYGTDLTDNAGRLTFTIPKEKALALGIYPVKMVVRGDHTSVNFCLAVLPPNSEVVVFSIDGSFTASVSIMGKDPKVRPGAVDVVRYWQELGYLIVYVTARPDMQHRQVTSWLAQHNFPRGLTTFMDGLSAEPLRQKTLYLQSLITEAQVRVHAAYGSVKDVTVYQQLGLKPEQIFIVGRTNKKTTKEATVISNGYMSHLTGLLLTKHNPQVKVSTRMQCHRQWFSQSGTSSAHHHQQQPHPQPSPQPHHPPTSSFSSGSRTVHKASSLA